MNLEAQLSTDKLVPRLLTDKSRLKEIYDLRVDVWENSEKGEFVNHQLFPNGWSDELDEKAFHWIITNEQDEIIASARLNIFNSLDEFPYYAFMKNLKIPSETPFGFYSRLVINPQYQGLKLSQRLVSSRIAYCEKNKIQWLQAFVTSERVKKIFNKLDFKIIGQVEMNYHEYTEPHLVNVFVKEYHYEN